MRSALRRSCNAVRSDLHQVAGAFELVGVEGLAVLVREFERHFSSDVESVPKGAGSCRSRLPAASVSSEGEMASGSPRRCRFAFIPEYLALGKAAQREVRPRRPVFPDLSRRPGARSGCCTAEPSRIPAFLLRQRRDFQRGLLQWLRGSEAGLDQMRRVISDIGRPILCRRNVRSGGRLTRWWWPPQTGMVEPSTALKQLLARIDLQVRRFVEGPRVSRTACAVKCSITLPVRSTATRWLTKSRICTNSMFWYRSACRARLMWLRCNRQSMHSAPSLVVARMPGPALTRVAAMPLRSCAKPPVNCRPHATRCTCRSSQVSVAASPTLRCRSVRAKVIGDDLSIEFATSLILIETAPEHIAALPSSFRTQVDRARSGCYATTNALIPVELRAENEDNSLTRLAQERQTISRVAGNRANMRLVEQALDAVFVTAVR